MTDIIEPVVAASECGVSAVAADLELAAKHMGYVLDALGIAWQREGMDETPARFTRAVDELTRGRLVDPRRHLARTFHTEGDGGTVMVRRIPVTSLCEHHLLPFDGLVTVEYLPAAGARIVGLSKLAHVAKEYAARATVQERVTRQVADAITTCLDADGVAVVMVSDHSCMSLRGATAHGADTITEVYRGAYTDPARQAAVLRKALA